MKILILANHPLGLYRFRRELIEELLKSHQVILSLPDGDLVRPLEDMGCTFIDTPFDRRGINPVADLRLFRTYRRMLRDIQPDVVLTYTVKPNIYGGFACRRAGIPYATNITGLGTAFQKNGLLRALVTYMYRVALKKAKTVFFENENDKKTLVKEHIVLESQCKLLHGAGVNLQDYPFSPYPSDDGVIHFLFVGRVMKEKGVDELFSCAKRIKETYGDSVCFDIVGPFDEDYKGIVDRLSEQRIIQYHGYQDNVLPFYRACNCLVMPSYHEGMNNVLQEAASSGRPLITTDIPGCREAVSPHNNGILCQPKNTKDLYRVLLEFLALPRERKVAMGISSRKRMESLFDRNSVIQETLKELQLL